MTQAEIKHYTNTLYYDLELTAIYCRMLGSQLIEKIYPNMNDYELRALDAIYCHPKICQRDLAKLILKDRANTGRIVDTLERKGFIKRYNDTKNKRLVKRLEITEEGTQDLYVVSEKLEPTYKMISQVISQEEIDDIRQKLKKLRESLSQAVEMQI